LFHTHLIVLFSPLTTVDLLTLFTGGGGGDK
jgi:hypothetical protein